MRFFKYNFYLFTYGCTGSSLLHTGFLPIFLKVFPFKKLFIYFNWRLITLQYCGGFCHTFAIHEWMKPQCTCVPHPEPASHLPPHPIPLGCPSTPALSVLFHASNLDWSSISHLVIYMFQCYSLKPSHPRLLPQSPKVFYICATFAVLHIGSSLASF